MQLGSTCRIQEITVLDSQSSVLVSDSSGSLQSNPSLSLPSSAPSFDDSLNATVKPAASSADLRGLKAEYFDNAELTTPVLTRTDPTVDFAWGTGSPNAAIAPDTFSARWTGQLQAKFSETYTFHTFSDDGIRLWVNGQLLIDNWSDHAAIENTGSISLVANQKYDLKLEYYERGGDAVAQLFWSSPSQAKEIIPQSQFSAPLEQTIPGGAIQTGEAARSANSFIDSLGIVTHLRYTDTSYGRYSDVVEPRLLELGIRHIRDGGNDPQLFEKLNRLGNLGIRSTFVSDPRDGISPADAVNIVKRVAASVIAIEGPNEWDVNRSQTYQGQPFPHGLRQYQTDLYRAIKGDPATAEIAVVAPSLAIPEYATELGSLDGIADMGNLHSYAGGNVPTSDYDWRWMPSAKTMTGDRPIVVTETGWHNAVDDKTASQRGVSEQVSAKYITRQYLDNFNFGIKRTFMYELMDERPVSSQENRFGLVRYDGTPKPAFYAVKNLVSLLNDTPGSTASGTLDFSLTGNVANIRHTLLQKSNGEFFLALWLHTPSTDASVSQQVTLNLATPISQAATYLPNRSTDATGQYAGPTQLTLDVPDEPLLVKLTPR